MKNVAVLTEDGAFAVFFRPHREGFDSSNPTPGNLPPKAKKMLMPGNQPGGGGGWELTDALEARCYYVEVERSAKQSNDWEVHF